MALRTGREYLAALEDGRSVWIDGSEVNVLTDSRTRPCIDAFAEIYDLQHDPDYQDLMVISSPKTGDPISLAFLEPRSIEDLRRKRAMVEFLARRTGGALGRLRDYKAPILMGLEEAAEIAANESPEYAANIRKYVDMCREGDLCLSHGFADPSHAKRPETNFPYLKVVEEREDGVVIRGAKAVATLAPFSEEFLGLTVPRPDLRPEEVLVFGIPVNSPGLKIICRSALTPVDAQADHPLSGYDEMDAWMVFDDVFVPRDRIFLRNRPDMVAAFFGPVVRPGMYHILMRMIVKAEVLIGIGAGVATSLGTLKSPSVQAALYDLTAYMETMKAFLTAAEANPIRSASGMLAYDPDQLTMGRIYGVDYMPKMLQRLREICGSGLIMSPGTRDRSSPEIGPLIEAFLVAGDAEEADRSKMFKLAWDYIGDSFAGRQLMFEQYNAATSPLNKAFVLSSYDFSSMIALARSVAGTGTKLQNNQTLSISSPKVRLAS